MSALISYFLLGLSLAAPIGPINAAQLDRGIKSGFWHSWLVGVGAMVADVLYMLVVYLGLVSFLEAPIVKIFLWTFGGFVLIYTGFESLFGSVHIQSDVRKSNETVFKSFMSGFTLSILNPLTILFWIGIYGSVLAETASKFNHEQLIVYSSAIIAGILLWDITMATVASSFRKFLTSRVLSGISVLSSLSLIGFGIYFGYQAYVAIFQ